MNGREDDKDATPEGEQRASRCDDENRGGEQDAFELPEPHYAHGWSIEGFRVDDPNGSGLQNGQPALAEVLQFVPKDLVSTLLEERIDVDVAPFHPALLPVPLLLGLRGVATPSEVFDATNEDLVLAPYVSPPSTLVPSLRSFRDEARRNVGHGAGVDRFYQEVIRLIREAMGRCRKRCRTLTPIDCTPQEQAVQTARDALADARDARDRERSHLEQIEEERARLIRALENFARSISSPSGTSSFSFGGVTFAFSSPQAAGRAIDAWIDEIGSYMRAVNDVERRLDNQQAALDRAENSVSAAEQRLTQAERALADCRRRAERRRRELEDCRERCGELERLLEDAEREQQEVKRRLEEERERRRRELAKRERLAREEAERERRRRREEEEKPQPVPQPPPHPTLPDPVDELEEEQALDGKQIRAGLTDTLFGIRNSDGDPTSCPYPCWNALKAATSIATDLIRALGWGVIGAAANAIPGSGFGIKLLKGLIGALCNFGASGSISDAALQSLLSTLGGKIFGKALGEVAGDLVNNLTSSQIADAFKRAIQADGIKVLEVEGVGISRIDGSKCRARARIFYNPKTGWVVMVGRCTCCPGIYVVEYRADKNGYPIGRPDRRILR